MFCLMDVSGSMGEREKDLAKRFFVLLHLFLKRRYDRTDIVFIRHTHEAQEVDEETFFYSTQSGGTVVSTALEEMRRIIEERYPSREWNIYAAQASDGDNFASNSERCISLLERRASCGFASISPMSRSSTSAKATSSGRTDNGTSLWRAYRTDRREMAEFPDEPHRQGRPTSIRSSASSSPSSRLQKGS